MPHSLCEPNKTEREHQTGPLGIILLLSISHYGPALICNHFSHFFAIVSYFYLVPDPFFYFLMFFMDAQNAQQNVFNTKEKCK